MSRFKGCGYLAGVAFLFVLLMTQPLHAQQVVGISAILNSTTSTEIDTYSATELDYYASLYYDAYVEGALYDNNSEIDFGAAEDCCLAEGYLTDPLTVGDIYTIISSHYLVAYYYYSGYGYYNPYNYQYFDGSGSDPSGTEFTDGGGPLYYDSSYILVGYTGVQMSSAPPNITSQSPGGAPLGTSGILTLDGTDLVDVFTGAATPSITGSGVSISVQSQSSTEVLLNYSIGTDPSYTGQHDITLSTRFGASNAAPFTAGDPTPVVNSVVPSLWSAGASTNVTITGTGFGTNPLVSVSSGYVSVSIIDASDTTIHTTMTVNPSAPDETVTVSVQSQGYNGSGFISTGQSPTGSNTANVQAIAAPAPHILYFGTDVTGTTKSVVVGEQIELAGIVLNLPAGLSITSQSWSNPPGTAIGGYNASTSGGAVVALPSSTGSTFVYYWIDAGTSRQMTYTYTMSNGRSNSATATFDVDGPSGVSVAVTQAGVGIISPPHNGPNPNSPLLINGALGVPGMNLVASASHVPSGAYQWIQLVDSDETQYISSLGLVSSALTGPPELDNTYPYGFQADGTPIGTVTTTNGVTNDTAQDSPNTALISIYGEMDRSFKATMYLTWLPAQDSDCTSGSACVIPAPLGSVVWEWAGDAINTLQPQVNAGVQYPLWILNCGTQFNAGFQPGGSLPQWSSTDH